MTYKDFLLKTFIFFLSTITLILVWKNLSEASTEQKLFYPEGKAILTSGHVCILNTAALESEALAISLTRACVKEHNRQSANSQ